MPALLAAASGWKILGLEGDQTLRALQLKGSEGQTMIVCAALFSFIGAEPNSAWLPECAALDDQGFVPTDLSLTAERLDPAWKALGRLPLALETSRPGLFAVGDARSGSTERVAAAVGEGSAAVRSVHPFLAFSH